MKVYYRVLTLLFRINNKIKIMFIIDNTSFFSPSLVRESYSRYNKPLYLHRRNLKTLFTTESLRNTGEKNDLDRSKHRKSQGGDYAQWCWPCKQLRKAGPIFAEQNKQAATVSPNPCRLLSFVLSKSHAEAGVEVLYDEICNWIHRFAQPSNIRSV